MKRHDMSIFIETASANRWAVAAHGLAGLIFVGSWLAFSVMISAFFGYHVPLPSPGAVAPSGIGALLAATGLALVAVAMRIAQSYLEARTMVRLEQAFVIQVDRTGIDPQQGTNLVRAANHYGRLASISMKAASTFVVLVVSGIAFPAILPYSYLATFALVTAVGAVVLYVVMRLLYGTMERTSRNLFVYAKEASAWKLQPGAHVPPDVTHYFRAYFFRVFLASVFGITGMAFSVIFCVFLLAFVLINGEGITFGDAFVVFMLLQAYLGMIGRLFGALVQGAAFMPAVRPFLRPGSTEPTDLGGETSRAVDLDDLL